MKTKRIPRPDLKPKTDREALRLLIDGFVLHHEQYGEVQIDSSGAIVGGNLQGQVEEWDAIELKQVDWFDDIPKEGVLCWVSNIDDAHNHPRIVTEYLNGKFLATYFSWRYATPIKPSECYQDVI